MLARRDTRREAARLRRLSPLQTLENQSPIWGIRCHSCTGREGLPPSWKLSYKTYVLRFTRESRFSFNQQNTRFLMCYPKSRRGQRTNCGIMAAPSGRGFPAMDEDGSGVPQCDHSILDTKVRWCTSIRGVSAHLAGNVLHQSPVDCLSLNARHWDSKVRCLCVELPWSRSVGSCRVCDAFACSCLWLW